MNYNIRELEKYCEEIEGIVHDIGLDCYEQEFEIISYEDMIGYATYLGMPSHYPHWSLGKNYERLKTYYSHNLTGIPYEMVINSNPCLAYLMKDNSLTLQILTMAHVYGHNDFFKNNYLFKEYTDSSWSIMMFKTHADRVRRYIQDPSIGYNEVERVLDAAHSIKFYCGLTHDITLPTGNLLEFLLCYGDLNDWEKDLLTIVMQENRYFLPQLETKVMNEGWASFWHYTIFKRLKLDSSKNFEFFTIHNNVISPTAGALNPYYLGFKIWEHIYNTQTIDTMFAIRELNNDSSFIRNYLTYEICNDSQLYSYQEEDKYHIISEVSNIDGWKQVRDTLIKTIGSNSIPRIEVVDWQKKCHVLSLQHIWDGRELNLSYATETLKYIQTLWGGEVILNTQFAGIKRQIVCDVNKKVLIQNE
ncbi:MAG: stage V sporulation protein R [Epulopiscium sp. Nuni2H_MBin001]|nr:MAG: stage V sporulation protein R [Epulopiscium sp. Nuni2H_MBin001]